MTFVRTTMPSPFGTLTLVASGSGLVAVLWQDEDGGRVRLSRLDDIEPAPKNPILVESARQVALYCEGGLDRFRLPLDLRGTAFQCDVWRALVAIPFGATRTYGEMARQLGRPAASRAVGAANGRNPLSIVVPCHRLVGSDGGLTGFAGGLAAKRWLLDLEAGAGGFRAPHRAGRTAP